MATALKHFLIAGLLFGLAIGWLLTVLVNSAVGSVIGAVIGQPATSQYWASSLLTAISITLIGGAIYAGNRVFRRRVQESAGTKALVASTVLFSLIPITFAGRELLAILSGITEHTYYYHHHSAEALMELSLPLVRLVFLPAMYFVVAWCTLRRHTSDKVET